MEYIYILAYLAIINIIAFILMYIDKKRAGRNDRRISEKSLFLSAIFGGSVGAIAGMYCFRHKTKHKRFTIGLPTILILQVALILIIKNFYTTL